MTGLEALEKISKVDYCFLEGELDGFFGMFSEEYNIIKKALEKYEELKEMYKEVCKSNRILDKKVLELNKKTNALKSQVVGLENAYDKLADKFEKYYKALEIIKGMFKDGNYQLRYDGKNYFIWDNILMATSCEITKEEYDLLKEVLL